MFKQQLIKRLFFTIISFLLISPSFAQLEPGDKIVGEWLNEEKNGKIEIYKTGNLYFGKLIGGNSIYEADGQSLQKDKKNPDEKLRSRHLLNLVILHHFEYKNDIWDDGKIYDPKSGKTYHCLMKLRYDKLEIRGYVGISLLGRTTYWVRQNN